MAVGLPLGHPGRVCVRAGCAAKDDHNWQRLPRLWVAVAPLLLLLLLVLVLLLLN